MKGFRSCTDKEKAAMEAVKAAVKGLPRGVTVGIDCFGGRLQFWKATPNGPGSAEMIGEMRTSKTDVFWRLS